MTRFLVFIATLALDATSLHAKPIVTQHGRIEVTVNRDAYEMLVGDIINISIEAKAPNGTTISQNTSHSFDPFQIIDTQAFLDIPDGAHRVWQWHYALDSFDASATQVSLPSLEWSDLKGDSGLIMIDPIEVKMQSAVDGNIQEATLEDIKGYQNLSTTKRWTTFTIVGAGALLLAILLYFIFKRRQTHAFIPPHEEAMLAFDSLQSKQLEFHPFYTELSGIVRRYIERRFRIYAQRQTTREFLNQVKQHPLFEQLDRHAITSFLTAADLVKFAKHIPSEEAKSDALKQAIAFVEHTREVESLEQAA